MRRPRYKDVIEWIVQNDDHPELLAWIEQDGYSPLVTVSMVMDLFLVEEARIKKDISVEIKRQEKIHASASSRNT